MTIPDASEDREVPLATQKFYEALFSDSVLMEFWDGVYANCGYWDSGTTTGRQACDRLVDESLRAVELSGSPTILEVACGQGGTTQRLKQHFPDAHLLATGIEPEQLQNARSAFDYSVDWLVAKPSELPIETGSVDLVICFEAAFHFQSREKFFHEARRVLKPDGYFVLSDLLLARSAPFMPSENYLRSESGYRSLLKRVGFDAEVRDITGPGWKSFRRNLSRFIGRRPVSAEALRAFTLVNMYWAFAIRRNLLAWGRPAH